MSSWSTLVSSRTEENKVVLEAAGFRLEFEPYMAIKGKLSRPLAVSGEGDKIHIEYSEGEGRLTLTEWNATTIVVEASAREGFTENGVIIELKSRLEGCVKLLLYHYTYDPEGYFGEAEEPYPYPQLREAGELQYCPWSYPVHVNSLDNLPRNLKVSQLLARGDGAYAFLLPISNAGARAHLTRFEGGFSVILDTGLRGPWTRALVLALSASPNPYKAVKDAYEAAMTLAGRAHLLRKHKRLPEVFKHLGWCSWNAFWREPSEEKILAAYKSLLESGVKPGFVLIDDGWQDEENRRIKSLEPDPRKFPRGFKNLVRKLKDMGAKYVGLWHTLNVHWNGVASGSKLAEEFREYLLEVDGYLVPDPSRSFELFKEWYGRLKSWGFDFVKVDNQSFVGYAYRGKLPIEEAARLLHEGLEAAAHLYALDVLNCMAQEPENSFNWIRSAVSRNCVDYIVPHKSSRDKLHILFNAYNALWMSQLVWPDWDMFQSHDPWALPQAVARAVSGGPVYLTDEPGRTNPEVVKPLAFSDGSLPLPDEPALPTEDSLMRDPYNEPVPLKVFSKASVDGAGVYGIVAAFNITRDDVSVRGSVTPSDALPPKGEYLIYEYFSEALWIDGKAEFELEPMGVKLFIIAPKHSWLTAIGTRDVYVMPKAITWLTVLEDEAILRMREPGLLVARVEGNVRAYGGTIQETEPLLKVKCHQRVIRLRLVR